MTRFLLGVLVGLSLSSCWTPPKTVAIRSQEGILLLTIDTETGEATLTREAWFVINASVRLPRRR